VMVDNRVAVVATVRVDSDTYVKRRVDVVAGIVVVTGTVVVLNTTCTLVWMTEVVILWVVVCCWYTVVAGTWTVRVVLDKSRLVVTDVAVEKTVAVGIEIESAVDVTCTVWVESEVTVMAPACISVTLLIAVVVIHSGIAVVVTDWSSSVNGILVCQGESYQYARSCYFW
jgi:hypothetical protein